MGLCKPTLFFLTESISYGPPRDGCFNSMWKDLKFTLITLTIGPLLAAIFIFLSLIAMCSVCCSSTEKTVDKDDDSYQKAN